MTWQIGFVLLLLLATLASFIAEKIPPDLTSMTVFAVILASGLLTTEQALAVFANPAPLTVGAMFIISAGLARSGVIDLVATKLEDLAELPHSALLLMMMLVAGTASAFINNTPVVVVLMPIVLGLAARSGISGSRLLIPLSYASILGGTCTLMGTSTNLLVSAVAEDAGQAPFGMFEMARVGVPMFIAGLLYLVFVGSRILPDRETVSSLLPEEERREYITEASLTSGSSEIGQPLIQSRIAKLKGVQVIDVIRNGESMKDHIDELVLEVDDRLVMACRASAIARARSVSDESEEFGLNQVREREGMVVEAIIGPSSSLNGQSLTRIRFRQRYRLNVLAIHRKEKNLSSEMATVELRFGDTLLMLGTEAAIERLQGNEDVILLGKRPVRYRQSVARMTTASVITIGAIAAASLGLARIEVAALVACALLFLTGCIRTRHGYKAVQWNLLFIIYGMLALGAAIAETGAAAWFAEGLVSSVTAFTSPDIRPHVMLACVYLLTNALTEALSNNAAAVLMAAFAIGIAESLGVDMRPFLLAVTIAASSSFATPIGYQTNTYVYAAGGYRFRDFVKVGLPLNFICFLIAVVLIPVIWPF